MMPKLVRDWHSTGQDAGSRLHQDQQENHQMAMLLVREIIRLSGFELTITVI